MMHLEDKPTQVEMDAMLGSLSNHDNQGNHGNERLEFPQFARLIDMKVEKEPKKEKKENGLQETKTEEEKGKQGDKIRSIEERNTGHRNMGLGNVNTRDMRMGNGALEGMRNMGERYMGVGSMRAYNWMVTEVEDEEPGVWFADV